MNTLAIRHGLSTANDRKNYGTPAFGSPDATLMSEGIRQATNLNSVLTQNYMIDPANTTVAVSKMRRTWETANFAGFHTLRPYESLNEATRNLTLEEIAHIRATRELPRIALQAAENLLNNPPEEKIWFSHGLLIASMCKVLDIHQDKENFIPRFCEIRELPV